MTNRSRTRKALLLFYRYGYIVINTLLGYLYVQFHIMIWMNWMEIKRDIRSMAAIYRILSHILLFGIFLDKYTERTVTQTVINSQNRRVTSFALKLFSTIFPASSGTGQPQPNQSTRNRLLIQLKFYCASLLNELQWKFPSL